MTLKPFGRRVVVGEIGNADNRVENAKNIGLLIPESVTQGRTSLMKAIVIEAGTEAYQIHEEYTVYFRQGAEYEIDGKVVVDLEHIVAFDDGEE